MVITPYVSANSCKASFHVAAPSYWRFPNVTGETLRSDQAPTFLGRPNVFLKTSRDVEDLLETFSNVFCYLGSRFCWQPRYCNSYKGNVPSRDPEVPQALVSANRQSQKSKRHSLEASPVCFNSLTPLLGSHREVANVSSLAGTLAPLPKCALTTYAYV